MLRRGLPGAQTAETAGQEVAAHDRCWKCRVVAGTCGLAGARDATPVPGVSRCQLSVIGCWWARMAWTSSASRGTSMVAESHRTSRSISK